MATATLPKPAQAPPSLSFSRMSTAEQCLQKYKLRYVDKVPAIPQGTFAGGKAVHAVIEVSEAEGWWPDVDLFQDGGPAWQAFGVAFGQAIDEAGGEGNIRWGGRKSKEFPNGEDVLWWCKMGPSFLRRYSTIRRLDEQSGIKVIESSVEARVGVLINERHVIGYPDCALAVDADGTAIVRDWKTGYYADPWQLAIYAYLLKHARKLTITHGQIAQLRSPNRERWLTDYDLTKWIELVPQYVTDHAALIDVASQANTWPVSKSSFCKSCPVRPACWWGATLDDGGGDE